MISNPVRGHYCGV